MPTDSPHGTAPFAIYRAEKITTLGALGASSAHMMRTIPTPNADPARADDNFALVGSNDPAADVRALLPEMGARNAAGHLLRRANSVLAIEVLLTTSPEWWDAATEDERADWAQDSQKWLEDEYGADNIAALRFHGDERTGHLTGFIVPRDPETGALNARRWLGGRERLAGQQDRYAAAVAGLGLHRGIRGSTARHERVRRFYGALGTAPTPLAVPVPPRIVMKPEAWAKDAAQDLAHQMEPTRARAASASIERTKRKAADAQAARDRGRAERADAALADAKARADRVRSLPLPDVLSRLGFEQDPKEQERWKAEGFNITHGAGPKAGKWWDHLSQSGGGGAIDLVKHAMGCDFNAAVSWLADTFGAGATVADMTAEARRQAARTVREAVETTPPFTPPSPAPQHWPQARAHLIEERRLRPALVDEMHERGDVYADERRNLVMVARDDAGAPVAAELKGTRRRQDGTRFAGLAPGSKPERGAFRVGRVDRASAVYVTESGIDAMALWAIRAEAGERGHAVISTAGARHVIPRFLRNLAATVRRLIGYDADAPGDKAASRWTLEGWTRLRPEGAKDWADLWWKDQERGAQGGEAPQAAPARPSAARKPEPPLDEETTPAP